jgi:CRISPR-associated protein Cas2
MAVRDLRSWIIAYDIADPQRLRQVHAFLVKHAHAVQYSVFLAVCTEKQLDRLLESISGQISPAVDDVRAYALPEWACVHFLGFAHPIQWILAGEDLPSPARALLDPDEPRDRSDDGFLIEGL